MQNICCEKCNQQNVETGEHSILYQLNILDCLSSRINNIKRSQASLHCACFSSSRTLFIVAAKVDPLETQFKLVELYVKHCSLSHWHKSLRVCSCLTVSSIRPTSRVQYFSIFITKVCALQNKSGYQQIWHLQFWTYDLVVPNTVLRLVSF